MDRKVLSPAALQGFGKEGAEGIFEFEEELEKDQLGKKLELWLQRQDPLKEDRQKQKDETWIVLDLPVSSRLQNGPNCGLVAMWMAIDALVGGLWAKESAFQVPILSHLLQLARDQGFSKEGEMFIASQLVSVALEVPFIHQHINAWEEEWDDPLQIFRHVLQDRVVLVPYDVSPNNEPANAKGHKAHWALIKGFCFPIDSFHLSSSSHNSFLDQHTRPIPNVAPDEDFIVPFRWSDTLGSVSAVASDLLDQEKIDPQRLLLVATQGRSKHVQLWSNSQLWMSNHQLVDPSISRTSAQRWIIPPNLDGLRNKLIVLSRKTS